ncbi:MAG TPA: copper chaperone PCu(A)C [Steroidobacteraceae bacterium]|nr:copper chaperone PCu(A)C [Steroidobacteraceae bacterium]
MTNEKAFQTTRQPDRRRTLFAMLLLFGGLLSLRPAVAAAHSYAVGNLQIEYPWSRVTAQGVPVGVGYLVITNRGAQADSLVAASTDVAERVEFHQTRNEGGMMKMRHMPSVALPAGAEVRFEPGGLHLMLLGLRRPLVAGETIPLLLRFAKAGELRVELTVEAHGSAPKELLQRR